MWGPDHEDASELLRLSGQMPQLNSATEQTLALMRRGENYRS